MSMSSQQFISEINKLLTGSDPKYLDATTAFLNINFNAYEPSLDRFVIT